MSGTITPWPSTAVKDLCSKVTSGGTPNRKESDYFTATGIPWVKTKELHDQPIWDTAEHITESGLRNSAAKLLPARTVLVAMYGATAGKLGILGRPMACNQACCALIVDETRADYRFVYYALLAGRDALTSLANGAAQQNLNVGTIANTFIPNPNLIEQQAIASILGALDDKIAGNDRIANNYEETLRLRFRRLEIDIDPAPNNCVRAAELIDFNPRLRAPTQTDAVYLDMAALPTTTARVRSWTRRPPKSGTRFTNGDTVMARITPCLENGKTAYVDFLEKGEVGVGSTEFIVMRSRTGYPPHLSYFLARSPRFRENAIRNMVGSSGRQRVAASALLDFPLNKPDRDAVAKFGEAAAAAFAHMKSLDAESNTLAELRDTLLPRLMSGEIRVRDAEKVAEDAA